MTLTLEIDKDLETFIKNEAKNNNVWVTQYFIELAKNQKEKTNFKADIVQSIQELNLVKQWKLQAKSINHLFNA